MGPPPLDYVGVKACEGCHADETKRWRGSQHERAMQRADERSVQGDFSGRSFEHQGDAHDLLASRRPLPGPHRRPRRAHGRVPGRLRVRRRAARAVPDRAARRPAAGARSRVGQPAEAGRAASASSTSTRASGCRRPTCCTGRSPRRTGTASARSATPRTCARATILAARVFHTTYSELSVSCEACHGPGSRHVEWARAARERGREPAGDPGLLVRFDERKRRTWTLDPERGIARPSRVAGERPRGRELRALPRAPGRPERGVQAGAPARGDPPPGAARGRASTTPTGRCATRSTTGARSCRAGCTRRASPARTATTRTPRACAPTPTRSAPPATRASASRRASTTSTARRARAPRAWPATCGTRPTWWSTCGTTTRSGCRGPT